ncbi:ArsC/Spx/MgsR family protein [Lactococcus garvieae]|uniref:ArsC/Spx/MgsR family protein n=1 Tax=Lactococcus garvieae TaxID=1363 RepID=UPI00031DCE4C|nr:ArsC/Spx/MgsR family protein [Lactococcus garvieae]
MITIYYRGSCNSSKRAIKWFEEHSISFEKVAVNRLPHKELLRLLSLTDSGFTFFIKSSTKINSKNRIKVTKLLDLSFNEAINYLNVHSELIQTPIIVEGDKIQVGYSGDEIRKFIPIIQRRVKLIKY